MVYKIVQINLEEIGLGFELRNDGKLIPEGVNSNSCDGDNPTINANCTARVVKDGFKVKYNW